jgi:hypothetical protein
VILDAFFQALAEIGFAVCVLVGLCAVLLILLVIVDQVRIARIRRQEARQVQVPPAPRPFAPGLNGHHPAAKRRVPR